MGAQPEFTVRDIKRCPHASHSDPLCATPSDPPPRHAPLVPTVVVASYKGGVGKTALTVALAERLAWAGLRVLLLTCDSQEDARHRLGVPASDPLIARRAYGPEGSVTVAGIRGTKAVDLLYRLGPEQLGLGSFDIAVVDTPPEVQGGSLPGVLLLTPVDGTDAARNLLTMLRRTPECMPRPKMTPHSGPK